MGSAVEVWTQLALKSHSKFDFDVLEVVNNRPMNIWLYAKCRRCVDPDEDIEDQAEVEVSGKYDGNPTGM